MDQFELFVFGQELSPIGPFPSQRSSVPSVSRRQVFAVDQTGRCVRARTNCSTFHKTNHRPRGGAAVSANHWHQFVIAVPRWRDPAKRSGGAIHGERGPREVLRSIGDNANRLTWLQAERCKTGLAAYLSEKGLADAGYCGLTTALVRHIEQELRSDNNSFAQQAWGRSWAEIFAADTAEEFTPNDFEMCRPAWFTARRLQRAIREMKEIVHEILLDPALAVEAPWNDVRQRSGRIFPEQPLGR